MEPPRRANGLAQHGERDQKEHKVEEELGGVRVRREVIATLSAPAPLPGTDAKSWHLVQLWGRASLNVPRQWAQSAVTLVLVVAIKVGGADDGRALQVPYYRNRRVGLRAVGGPPQRRGRGVGPLSECRHVDIAEASPWV